MLIFKTVVTLQHYLHQQRTANQKIGFVPTMGALHQGHLTLVQYAKAESQCVVCSIFVNPTQFGDPKDLEKYPRPIESDIEKLEKEGCDVLFLPDVTEIYPPHLKSPHFDLAGLDQTMEGAHRPGHFDGVAEVVHRLLDIVQPLYLYMGQKDYQQFTIIKHLLKTLNSSIKLVRVPIIREPDGLAMSSRNIRLSEEGRKKSIIISQTLFQAQKDAQLYSLQEVKKRALKNLENMEVDYFEIVDGNTLRSIDSFEQAELVTACTTVRIDGVRLLDNIILKELL